MTDKVIVFVNCESKEQASQLAQALVSERLAACVNLIPGVHSCYIWNEKVTWSEEVTCFIKTTRGAFGALQGRIRQLHSYSVPEIISIAIDEGHQGYLDWIDDSVNS